MTTQQDEHAIHELVSTFIAGWNSGNGNLLAAPFAIDADFTAVGGQRAKGRAVIAAVHNEILSTVFRGTRNSATVNDVRFLRSDVAAVDVTFRIQPMVDKPWLPAYSTCGFIATKQDGNWSIAIFRNMIPFERPTGGGLDGELLNARESRVGARSE